ncbi:hypothetical protein GA0115255_122723, partial [Streptomyces sp. Ncost-T6T-2b]
MSAVERPQAGRAGPPRVVGPEPVQIAADVELSH